MIVFHTNIGKKDYLECKINNTFADSGLFYYQVIIVILCLICTIKT